MDLSELKNDYDKAEALLAVMIVAATGGERDEPAYTQLREHFVHDSHLTTLLPLWFPSKRSLAQFWPFIQGKYPTYQERRNFLNTEFEALVKFCEESVSNPVHRLIDDGITSFDRDGINRSWKRMIERSRTDPEAAITAARTLLETTCKHILDDRGIEYDDARIELGDLYKKTADALNLSPGQHEEGIFKQILGGCSGVVNGLGTLRNKFGDSHGKGPKAIKPAPRHAQLAVNLAGSMALFLIQTHETKEA